MNECVCVGQELEGLSEVASERGGKQAPAAGCYSLVELIPVYARLDGDTEKYNMQS